MGLWQKLLGWLNPSAPTAATAADSAHAPGGSAHSAHDAPLEPGFEPGFSVREPAAERTATVPAADANRFERMDAEMDAAVAAQPDLFDAAFANDAQLQESSARQTTATAASPPPVAQSQALQDVLSVYAGMAWDRQLDFADKVGERSWSADTSKGQIQFGDDLRFTMQVLGSYAFQSRTWQWIWANTQAQVDPAYTEVARQLLAFGNEQGLPLLTQPRTEMDEADLHQLGLIASGADESAGYYLGNYGDGILLALIDPGQGLPSRQPRPERVLTVVPQLISQFELNHRLLLQHYLPAKGFAVQETATQITGQQGASRIVAEFDAQGRVVALNGTLAG